MKQPKPFDLPRTFWTIIEKKTGKVRANLGGLPNLFVARARARQHCQLCDEHDGEPGKYKVGRVRLVQRIEDQPEGGTRILMNNKSFLGALKQAARFVMREVEQKRRGGNLYRI